MPKQELIELTIRAYKITLLFPKKEPLRYKIREKADEILEGLVSLEVFHSPINLNRTGPGDKKEIVFNLERDLSIINSYFEIAKWQNWVSYFDLLEVQEKYDKIKCDLEKEDSEEEKSLKMEFSPLVKPNKVAPDPVLIVKENKNLDSRKEKILEFLKEKEKVQVWQVKEIFPQITKRTLRRDFEKLLRQGLIERIGERNETFYKLKTQEI